MAVYGVWGLPRSGKTTFLTAAAIETLNGHKFMRLKPHKKVLSTFPLDGCYKLNPYQIGKIDIQDSLLLIDEISSFFDARNWKVFPEETRTWFQLHGHYHCDVIFCSQYWSDADARLRNLAERYYLLEPSIFPHVSFVKPIDRILGVVDGQIQDSYSIGSPISWTPVLRWKYYKYFDSYAQTLKLDTLQTLDKW